MSDGIAPAIDKVGAPAPTAPEAQAGAPALDTTAAPVVPEKPPAEQIAEETKDSEDVKASEVAKHIAKIPKPVEVMSVPETPVNATTPAGGTPRPELNIPTEPNDIEKNPREPVVMTGVQEPLPTPTASVPNSDVGADSIIDKPATPNGHSKAAEMTGALQADEAEAASETTEAASHLKRKLDDATPAAVDDSLADKQDSDASERSDKKTKIDVVGAKTNGGARKPGRPKKDKTAPPVVGRTARKTRSQGPVEV